MIATAAPAPSNRLGSILKPRRELSVESIKAAAAERIRQSQALEAKSKPLPIGEIVFVLS
jgi:hypothetical protein